MEIDLSALDAATREKVDEIFRKDFDLKVLRAIERQHKAAMQHWLNPPRWSDGLGPRTLAVDPMLDALWRQHYGHNYSDDKALLEFLRKRNPEIAVRSVSPKVMVGYAPGSASKRPVGKEEGEAGIVKS